MCTPAARFLMGSYLPDRQSVLLPGLLSWHDSNVPWQEMLPPANEEGPGAPRRNVVAADGRVFEQFQAYRELLRDGIQEILGVATANNFVLKVRLLCHFLTGCRDMRWPACTGQQQC